MTTSATTFTRAPLPFRHCSARVRAVLASTHLVIAASACGDSSSDTDRGGDSMASGDSSTLGGDQSGWSITVVDEQPGFKSRASLAIDGTGSLHLAYNVASSPDGWTTPDVWYASDSTGAWETVEAQAANDISNEFPVIVVAGSRRFVVYNRYVPGQGQVDVFYTWADGDSDFAPAVNLTQSATRDEFAPVAVAAAGVVHVLYQQATGGASPSYSIGYSTIIGTSPGPHETVASSTASFSLGPDYNLAAAGEVVHVVYSVVGDTFNNILTHRRWDGESWSQARALTQDDLDVWGPGAGLDHAGDLHLVYTKGVDYIARPLWYGRLAAGSDVLDEQQLDASSDCRSYFSGVAVSGDGRVHVLYRVFDEDANADLFYRSGQAGVFDPVEPFGSTPGYNEDMPSVVLDALGRPIVSFVENVSNAPDGVLYVARRR